MSTLILEQNPALCFSPSLLILHILAMSAVGGERGRLRVWWGACLWGPCLEQTGCSCAPAGDHSPRAQWWHLQLRPSAPWRAQGRENSKEELLWFIKCSYITVGNELPVRHNAMFGLMGTLITSRYKCSCVVKTWRCHAAFWTRSGVLQQSSSFSLLSHLQDHIFYVPSEPGSWKHSALFPPTPHQVKLAKRNDAWGSQNLGSGKSRKTKTLILANMMCMLEQMFLRFSQKNWKQAFSRCLNSQRSHWKPGVRLTGDLPINSVL